MPEWSDCCVINASHSQAHDGVNILEMNTVPELPRDAYGKCHAIALEALVLNQSSYVWNLNLYSEPIGPYMRSSSLCCLKGQEVHGGQGWHHPVCQKLEPRSKRRLRRPKPKVLNPQHYWLLENSAVFRQVSDWLPYRNHCRIKTQTFVSLVT